MPRYNAVWHWAKLEPQHDPEHPDPARLARVRERLAKRFGQATLNRFGGFRAVLDPTVSRNERVRVCCDVLGGG